MAQNTILVVGGAGYIGSHMVKMLGQAGYRAIVLDDLSAGSRSAVVTDDLYIGDMADVQMVDKICAEHKIDAVIHFAACIDVGESVREPNRYYNNNVAKSIGLLNGLVRNGIRRMIFSSTCSVYGVPETLPVTENSPTLPVNPYGHSKLIIEQILKSYEVAHGVKHVVLRYFNAAGADPEGELGENHDPETHLIPIALRVANARLPHLNLLGTKYDTHDGSGVRDYIHVWDLCSGHLLALRDLLSNGPSAVYNLGNGEGYSVLDVVKTVERVTGRHVRVEVSGPRPSEPSKLIADSSKARDYLGWEPEYPKLEDMVLHAWKWETRNQARKVDLETG